MKCSAGDLAYLPPEYEALLGEGTTLVITGSREVRALHCGQESSFPVETLCAAEIANTIGCGDSFSAGFISEYVRGTPVAGCVRKGIKTASAVLRLNEAYIAGPGSAE